MFRSRFGKTVIIIIGGIFVGVGILLTFAPSSVPSLPEIQRMIIRPRAVWFNESLEKELDVLHDKRRWVMRETCKRLNNSYSNKDNFTIDPAKFYNIYVNDEYKFLYCSVPKVACSNWKRALLSLLGIEDTEKIPNSDLYDHTGKYYQTMRRMQLNMYTKEEVEYRLKHYTKFVFVREPFERLLSAWRNKFTVASNLYFQSRWGAYIVKRYRDNPSQIALNRGNDVAFPEFVRFLLSPQTVKDNMHNDHWQSFESLCYPCIVEYDYIGKYKTMDQDIKYITDKLQAYDLKFPERSVRYKHKPTYNYVDAEYAKIPLSQIHDIFEYYKDDFAIFNYEYKSFDKYDPNPPQPAVLL